MLSPAPTHWPLSTLWTPCLEGTLPGSRCQGPAVDAGLFRANQLWSGQRWGRQAWAEVVQPGGRRDPPEAS